MNSFKITAMAKPESVESEAVVLKSGYLWINVEICIVLKDGRVYYGCLGIQNISTNTFF